MKNKPLRQNVILLFIVALSTTANAQGKRPHLLIGAHMLYANPQGSFSNAYSFGIGGEVSGGIGFNKTYFTGTYGSSIFFADNENSYGNLTVKPIKFGIKHYLLANKLFVTGDLGVGKVKDKTMSTSESHFMRGIGAGVHFLGLEGGIYYDGWKSVHGTGFSNNVLVKVGWSKLL